MLPLLILTIAITGIAACTDLRTGRIPNWLTMSGILLGITGHVVQGWHTLGWQAGLRAGVASLAGLALCSFAPLVLYWKGGMGGGDLKLFAAIGALCQPMLGLECEVYSLIIAGLVAPAKLAYRGHLFRVLGGSIRVLLNPILPVARRKALPAEALTWFRLGPAILAGALVTLLLHAETWSSLGKVLVP